MSRCSSSCGKDTGPLAKVAAAARLARCDSQDFQKAGLWDKGEGGGDGHGSSESIPFFFLSPRMALVKTSHHKIHPVEW